MEISSSQHLPGSKGIRTAKSTLFENINMGYWILVLVNYLAMFVGSISSSLLSRFYFIHGGSSRWISTWVQSAGFPLLLVPIYITRDPKPFSMFTRKLFLISVGIGLLTGVNNFLISWGISYLPVSTSSLLLSSQLAFNLLLSVLLVKQKLHFTNINCVMLLTLSSILLALGSSHDRPEGVTKAQFFLGFASILGAAGLFALYLPIMEMVYKKVLRFQMVLEMQVVIQTVATLFATVGMLCDGGLGEVRRESEVSFNLGEWKYWLTVGFTVVTWQMCFMGTAGVVYLTTSLTAGICMTALLPMNVLGGVIAFGDDFGGQKAVSTVLCLWGFASYLYGEYIKQKNHGQNQIKEEMGTELSENSNASSSNV
ncbi:probable purine permease 4 [Aristolochia californica]|uniref:probable purine permease 4 n=1 Tax=Aristolochia californica TaxID=171875 RepID=UPI0035DDA133